MEALVLVLGVLSAGLSAADPPDGLYISAEGVSYVGCFEHGEEHHEDVLNIQINYDCTFNHPESCQTPPTCINSCQSTDPSYVYIGLKHPGHCFCDSALRGVNQIDSANGAIQCDARCIRNLTLACGSSYYMLVYRATAKSVGYTTKPEEGKTTLKIDNARPQNTTAVIAGAAAGGAAVLIAGSVVGVCLWRKRRRGDKPRTSHALQDMNLHTSQPSSDSFSNPTVPPTPTNIDALYAKPDKKRKHKKMSSPDDPSYQDVIPTGAQHQYATVNDDLPPNSSVQQDPNPYGSIQNDPQYAVVHKGPRYRPNVDVNPIYMGGETGVSPEQEISGMTEMVDNVIYE